SSVRGDSSPRAPHSDVLATRTSSRLGRAVGNCGMCLRMRTAVALALLFAACVEKEPEVDQSYVKSNLLTSDPTPQTAVHADLDRKITYLGADLDHTTLTPGDTLKITHYWKVVAAPGGDWRVFTHVQGAGSEWLNIDATKMRSGYGPEKWKAGDII